MSSCATARLQTSWLRAARPLGLTSIILPHAVGRKRVVLAQFLKTRGFAQSLLLSLRAHYGNTFRLHSLHTPLRATRY